MRPLCGREQADQVAHAREAPGAADQSRAKRGNWDVARQHPRHKEEERGDHSHCSREPPTGHHTEGVEVSHEQKRQEEFDAAEQCILQQQVFRPPARHESRTGDTRHRGDDGESDKRCEEYGLRRHECQGWGPRWQPERRDYRGDRRCDCGVRQTVLSSLRGFSAPARKRTRKESRPIEPTSATSDTVEIIAELYPSSAAV